MHEDRRHESRCLDCRWWNSDVDARLNAKRHAQINGHDTEYRVVIDRVEVFDSNGNDVTGADYLLSRNGRPKIS